METARLLSDTELTILTILKKESARAISYTRSALETELNRKVDSSEIAEALALLEAEGFIEPVADSREVIRITKLGLEAV